jgi:hypothetical protein
MSYLSYFSGLSGKKRIRKADVNEGNAQTVKNILQLMFFN